jgi:hypothetical protein
MMQPAGPHQKLASRSWISQPLEMWEIHHFLGDNLPILWYSVREIWNSLKHVPLLTNFQNYEICCFIHMLILLLFVYYFRLEHKFSPCYPNALGFKCEWLWILLNSVTSKLDMDLSFLFKCLSFPTF